MVLSNRAAWLVFNGSIPPDKRVLHRCDVPSCVNPTHLFLGTMKENSCDMVNKRRNRYPVLKGESNPMSKLTIHKASEIKSLYACGDYSLMDLASRFGVTRSTVFRTVHGKTFNKGNSTSIEGG